MSKKIYFLFFLFFCIIFFHYQNKHTILKHARSNERLLADYNSQKSINAILTAENNKLGSRAVIQRLAFEKLGMFYPENPNNIFTITMNKKNTFYLIDYITPRAEALTN